MRVPVSGVSRPSSIFTATTQFHPNVSRVGLLACLFAMALLCLVPNLAHAQFRTSIQGVVTDPTGAVIGKPLTTQVP